MLVCSVTFYTFTVPVTEQKWCVTIRALCDTTSPLELPLGLDTRMPDLWDHLESAIRTDCHDETTLEVKTYSLTTARVLTELVTRDV